jgi:hypothetical protein
MSINSDDAKRKERCTTGGGDWIAGLTDLTSKCAARLPDVIQEEYPNETSIVSQRLKDPPPAGFRDDQIAASLWDEILPTLLREDYAALSGGLRGVGPNGIDVIWPLTPGDIVWSAVPTDDGLDRTRRFGVFMARNVVIDFGKAERAADYWAAVPGNGRVTLVDTDKFVPMNAARCGVFNSVSNEDRTDIVRLAVVCVGTLLRRLTHPNAQHFAAYLATGRWRMTNMAHRVPRPIRVQGNFYPASADLGLPGYGTSGNFTYEIEGTEITAHVGSVALVTYNLIQYGEELYFQKQFLEPFRDPLIGIHLAEDTAAAILLEARQQAEAL